MASDASSSRPNQTAADYVTIVLSPVLIMGLVDSLVFFLLEVFYKTDGEWKERLQWILFFFVFGVVLAARISMQGDVAPRAPLYASILAVLTYLGMQWYVEYPPGVKELSFVVSFLLVGVVWWCSYRLTWDCTNVDEETDMSGEGLLQAAGLGEAPAPQAEEAPPTDQPLGWWERYQRYREQKQKKRILGVWVVYFSLAALPLFGLGQTFIPLDPPDRRRVSFWLMTVYIGCALGLLLTTSFLGLRRYLRQKRLQMPAAMTGTWLTVGGVLIVLLLGAGALLPRPNSEYSLRDVLDPAGAAKRRANRVAGKGDSPGKGRGQPGATKPDGEPDDKPGEQGKQQAEGKEGKAKGEQGAEEKDGKTGSRRRTSDPAKAAKGLKEMQQQDASSSDSSRMAQVQQFLKRGATILKGIVFTVLVLLVLGALLRSGLGFLSNFTDWAKQILTAWNRFWENLFAGRRMEEAAPEEERAAEAVAKRSTPFSAFANPFDNGQAERMPPRDLVRYTFAALEAWAREHDLDRREDETALEFVDRLIEETPALETEAKGLVQLHVWAEYAQESLPGHTAAVVESFWQRLEGVVEAPLSA